MPGRMQTCICASATFSVWKWNGFTTRKFTGWCSKVLSRSSYDDVDWQRSGQKFSTESICVLTEKYLCKWFASMLNEQISNKNSKSLLIERTRQLNSGHTSYGHRSSAAWSHENAKSVLLMDWSWKKRCLPVGSNLACSSIVTKQKCKRSCTKHLHKQSQVYSLRGAPIASNESKTGKWKWSAAFTLSQKC